MPAQPKHLPPRKLGRPAAAAAAAKDRAILEFLSAGPAGSALVAEHTKVPQRTVQYRLGRLKELGLVVEEPRGTFCLSGTGQGRVLASQMPKRPAQDIDPEALAALPDEHQAFLRLLTDAVVARRALASVYASHWPGFVLLGPSKTGKTLLAQLVCRRFGLAEAEHIRVLARETAGSIWGRRVSESGGHWRFEPAPLLALLFATFDEYDKAPADVQRAAQAYLQGDSEFVAEDERAWVRATTLVVLNDDRGTDVLPDPYLRRSVVLDTAALGQSTADIDEVARRLARAKLPRVSETLAPPERALPEGARALLRTVLRSALTERGWRLVDVEPMERLALGRWGADAVAGPEAAAVAVAADYLRCAATGKGECADDWASRVLAVPGVVSAAGSVATLAAARRRTEEDRARREAERWRAEEAQAALAAKRAELLARIDRALRSAPRALAADEASRVTAAREQARFWRPRIREADTAEVLGRLEAIARREVLDPIDALGRARADAAAAAARVKHQRAEQAAAAREQKARIDSYVARLQELYRRNAAIASGEVLDELLRLECVTRKTYETMEETLGSQLRHAARQVGRGVSRLLGPAQPAPPPDPIASLFQGSPYAYLGPPPSPPATPHDDREYQPRTWTDYVDRDGMRHAPEELRSWNAPAVKAVLRAGARSFGRTLKEPRRARAVSAQPRASRPARNSVTRKALPKLR